MVCRKCGKRFDEHKSDYVCPKCCFFNNLNSDWTHDNSWLEKYEEEDPSQYELERSLPEISENESRDMLLYYLIDSFKPVATFLLRFLKTGKSKGQTVMQKHYKGGKHSRSQHSSEEWSGPVHEDTELSGSHAHAEDGSVIKTPSAGKNQSYGDTKNNAKNFLPYVLLVIWMFLFFILFGGIFS